MLVFAWFKSDPKSHTPFDSRMPQNSSIWPSKMFKKNFACGGLSSKGHYNAHMHKLFLYLGPTPLSALTLLQRTATSNFTLQTLEDQKSRGMPRGYSFFRKSPKSHVQQCRKPKNFPCGGVSSVPFTSFTSNLFLWRVTPLPPIQIPGYAAD